MYNRREEVKDLTIGSTGTRIPHDFIEVSCDLCGGTAHDLLFTKEGFRHVRCRNCGLVFVNPRLKGHLEWQRQSGTGTMGESVLSRSQLRRIHRELETFEPYRKLNRILEVGAGRGWLLEQASLAGWETWAVEVNSQALEHLRTKPVHRIVPQSAELFEAPPASMDVVRMWDVIEHLESPHRALKRCRVALRAGGMLRLSTTNFASLSRWINGPEWVYLNGADHIHLFEPKTISMLLDSLSFTSIRVRTRSFNLRRKLYHPEQVLPPAAPLLRPLRKLIDEGIRFTPYGHQMIVTAVADR